MLSQFWYVPCSLDSGGTLLISPVGVAAIPPARSAALPSSTLDAAVVVHRRLRLLGMFYGYICHALLADVPVSLRVADIFSYAACTRDGDETASPAVVVIAVCSFVPVAPRA